MRAISLLAAQLDPYHLRLLFAQILVTLGGAIALLGARSLPKDSPVRTYGVSRINTGKERITEAMRSTRENHYRP